MKKVLRAREGFTLIELMIVIAVIGILAAVLIPYTFRAQERARETGVVNAARAIQTGLEMYASNRVSAPWYPIKVDEITSTSNTGLAGLVSPAPKNPFSGYGYLDGSHISYTVSGSSTTFFLGAPSTSVPTDNDLKGVIEYKVTNDSYTLTLYGANPTAGPMPQTIAGGR